MADVVAIVVAAGRGERFGPKRKQYCDLAGLPVVVHAVKLFDGIEDVGSVVVALPPGDETSLWPELVRRVGLSIACRVVKGGPTRAASVACALAAVPVGSCKIVLVHDAVRPLASRALVERVIAATRRCGAAVPVVTPRETVKRVSGDRVAETLDRRALGLAQTPQGFRIEVLQRAYQQSDDEATDDATLVEKLGLPIATVMGEETNLKITMPADLALCEVLHHMSTSIA